MPTSYQAPVEDYVFLLHEVLAPAGSSLIEGIAVGDTREVLTQAARFLEEVWAPLDSAGDEDGCSLRDGQVRTPAGYREAYARFCDAGWNSVAAPSAVGGAELPEVLAHAIREFAASACNSLGLYSGLTNGAHTTIRRTGAEWMQKHIVPSMVAGRWTGTMCLTEPHCGTDLRLMKTRAAQQADGSWRLSGTKIFITGGDHDLAENVVHLVLAKVPNALGQYVDDLSTVNLFLVSKQSIDTSDGSLGGFNGVTVGGLEHKMGLKGSATCTMHFENAVAWRLGETTRATGEARKSSSGMSGMFDMMNSARLGTGMQGLASAQRAYDHVARYARDRLAGRSMDPAHRTDAAADPIIVHPDVRRLLLKQAAFLEGARAFGLYVRALLDEPDHSRKVRSAAIAGLLTPVVKAWFSDRAFESANDAMQIMGGHGYIRENGVEQLVRDARIFQLYEGANGVQALDLVARKLPGSALAEFLEDVQATAAEAGCYSSLFEFSTALLRALDTVRDCGRWLLHPDRAATDAAGSAYDFLTMLGIVGCAWMWLRMAAAAEHRLLSGPSAFHQRKIALATYWFARELPVVDALAVRVRTGSACLMALPAEAF